MRKILNSSFPQVRAHCELRHTHTVVNSGSALTCMFLDHLMLCQQPHTCNGSHEYACLWVSPRRGARSGGTRRGASASVRVLPPDNTPPGVPPLSAGGDRGARIRSTDARETGDVGRESGQHERARCGGTGTVTSRNGHTPAMRFLEIFGAWRGNPGKGARAQAVAGRPDVWDGIRKKRHPIGHNGASDSNPCAVCLDPPAITGH